MEQNRILSRTKHALKPPVLLVFDVCQVGWILRTLLFMTLVAAVAACMLSNSLGGWLAAFFMLCMAMLPASLVWLVLLCLCKKTLAKVKLPWQMLQAIMLGAMSGLYGSWFLFVMQIFPQWYEISGAASGALLSGSLCTAMWLRAKNMEPKTKEAKLRALQAKIQPHFLFNALNSVIALMETQPEKAQTMLEDLSDLFRSSFSQAKESSEGFAVTTLKEEIMLARRYLAIEALRFGDRLRVKWQVDDDNTALMNLLVPPLMLQPLVENAVIHGVSPSPQGADILICLTQQHHVAVLEVSNTCDPKTSEAAQTKGMGMALMNVRERLALMYDLQVHFESGMQHKHGFVIKIKIQC